MLIEFRVENHRSIRDEQVLSLEAATIGDANDQRPRHVEGTSRPLLPVAALYGANASGKSNVLEALQFMAQAVLYSHRFWGAGEGVPREPFEWGKEKNEPSLFEIQFLRSGIRYEYGFVVSDQAVTEEWLRTWPRGRKQTWFEREGETLNFGPHLKGENRLVQKLTRPNALFLSTAAQNDHEQLLPVYEWFRRVRGWNLSRQVLKYAMQAHLSGAEDLLRDSDEPAEVFASGERRAELVTFLRAADMGILDVLVQRKPAKVKDWFAMNWANKTVMLLHESTADSAWLPLERESHGTQSLFRMAPVVLNALRQGGLLVIDELESGLHPIIATWLVQLFNDPVSNPANAQLVFSTHDTQVIGNLVGEPSLRRDQVWLTEKDREGVTHLYPLTNFKPRKGENIERGYLQGRYGGVPIPAKLLLSWADGRE